MKMVIIFVMKPRICQSMDESVYMKEEYLTNHKHDKPDVEQIIRQILRSRTDNPYWKVTQL